MSISIRAFLYLFLPLVFALSCDNKTDYGIKEETGLFPEARLKKSIKFYGYARGPIPEYEKRASIVIMPNKGDSIPVILNGKPLIIDATALSADIINVLPRDCGTISPPCS